MVIKSFHELDEEQEEQIRELEEICNEAEKTPLQSYVYLYSEDNRDPSKDCFYLLYEEGRLVCFLSVFAPRNEGEISAFTHPDFRRRGYFSALLERARQDWNALSKLSLVAQPASSSVPAVVKKLGAEYDFSEYMMYYDGKEFPQKQGGASQRLELKRAESSDRNVMAGLLASMFSMQERESAEWFDRIVAAPDVVVYKAVVGNTVAGTGCFHVMGDRMTLFGIGVKKALRGRGYGREILRQLVDEWRVRFGSMELVLETDSKSARAVSLFRDHGFKIGTQFDYYRLPQKV